jgi:hypothetical protein
MPRRSGDAQRGHVNPTIQVSLFNFAIGELVRQHRESFAPLWSMESWAKLMIWLALNCGCTTEPAVLEGFAAALGPALSSRMRRLFFERELEDLNLRLMADPAEPRVVLLPFDAVGPPPDEARGALALERVGLAPLTVDRAGWELLEGVIAVPWRQREAQPCA